jgi:predicted amidohydrolase
VKVAAYQARLLGAGSMEALTAIRAQVERCEREGVSFLCCPEAILGGLADYAERPANFAITLATGRLDSVLAPLASDLVTTIIGFTESYHGRLYNTAAVFHRGAVAGVYRKRHPAINRSVYKPGRSVRVFRVGAVTFGIVICNDSTHAEPARLVAEQGATLLFVPTNNGLPPARDHAALVAHARQADVAMAVENGLWVIRSDVAGRTDDLVSYGCSEIVRPDGTVMQSARQLEDDLIVAEIGP